MSIKGIICVVVWGLVEAVPVRAATESELRSLSGVTAVRVVVEELNRETQQTGLTTKEVRALAEERLRKDGLAVFHKSPGSAVPIVYIRLSAVLGGADESAPVSFYLMVHVKQFVRLRQDVPTVAPAVAGSSAPLLLVTTWENGTMVMARRNEFFFYIRHVLLNLLGELTQDWRAANNGAGES